MHTMRRVCTRSKVLLSPSKVVRCRIVVVRRCVCTCVCGRWLIMIWIWLDMYTIYTSICMNMNTHEPLQRSDERCALTYCARRGNVTPRRAVERVLHRRLDEELLTGGALGHHGEQIRRSRRRGSSISRLTGPPSANPTQSVPGRLTKMPGQRGGVRNETRTQFYIALIVATPKLLPVEFKYRTMAARAGCGNKKTMKNVMVMPMMCDIARI